MIEFTTELPVLLKVMGDPIRLRILGLLELQELSVGELSKALGLSQSRTSNHLRVLREAGLLQERHEGTSTYLRPARLEADQGYPARLWGTLREGLTGLAEHSADRTRLDAVLAERRADGREFFDRVAGEWDKLGSLFESGQARQRAAVRLLPDGLTLADLGCGTGYAARALADVAERLICVDRAPRMLDEARRRLESLGGGAQTEFRLGELDDLPLEDAELDGAVAAMVLHHLPALAAPLREMRRVLKPGGKLVVLELAPHRETWLRETLGDRHLGLEASDVLRAFRQAGFESVGIETVEDHYQPRPEDGSEPVSLPLYLVHGRAPL